MHGDSKNRQSNRQPAGCEVDWIKLMTARGMLPTIFARLKTKRLRSLAGSIGNKNILFFWLDLGR